MYVHHVTYSNFPPNIHQEPGLHSTLPMPFRTALHVHTGIRLKVAGERTGTGLGGTLHAIKSEGRFKIGSKAPSRDIDLSKVS